MGGSRGGRRPAWIRFYSQLLIPDSVRTGDLPLTPDSVRTGDLLLTPDSVRTGALPLTPDSVRIGVELERQSLGEVSHLAMVGSKLRPPFPLSSHWGAGQSFPEQPRQDTPVPCCPSV